MHKARNSLRTKLVHHSPRNDGGAVNVNPSWERNCREVYVELSGSELQVVSYKISNDVG